MAKTEVVNTKLKFNEPKEVGAAVTLTSEGAVVDYTGCSDELILLLIGGAAATIKAGDGIQATSDLTVPFETGKQKAVVVESGKYLFHTGEDKGKIVIEGTGATVQVIQLP